MVPLGDTEDRVFHVLQRDNIVAQDAHAQWRNLSCILSDFVSKHLQRTRRLARHQHALPFREQVANQVGNRVALACAGWTLNEHASACAETLNNLALLVVR